LVTTTLRPHLKTAAHVVTDGDLVWDESTDGGTRSAFYHGLGDRAGAAH
jgi:hypothetical protein